MKKKYVAPTLEVERYELDANIALHCQTVVTNGPAIDGHAACESFTKWEEENGSDFSFINGKNAPKANLSSFANFYQNCDCYYTAGEGQFWTS